MGLLTATAARPTSTKFLQRFRILVALSGSGFRRFATYRQATAAAAVTNTIFGFLRVFVLLAVAGTVATGGGQAAGYDRAQLCLFVWLGQGLLGVVLIWGWTDLADRIRTGEVVVDLLRPVHPVVAYLATDLGRAAYAALTRMLVPLGVGAGCAVWGVGGFEMSVPRRPGTYPLFAVSALLAVVVSFGLRYLVNSVAFWLLDIRGVMVGWNIATGVLSGLYFPVRFLPDPVAALLWYATPFPSLLQTPIDIAVERVPYADLLVLVAVQFGWAVAALAGCVAVQRRAERRLVIQGG